MICKECGADMYIDDRDRHFKGCEDIYWNCPDCQTSCIEEIRFSKSFRQLWHSENNNIVKDYIYKNGMIYNEKY